MSKKAKRFELNAALVLLGILGMVVTALTHNWAAFFWATGYTILGVYISVEED